MGFCRGINRKTIIGLQRPTPAKRSNTNTLITFKTLRYLTFHIIFSVRTESLEDTTLDFLNTCAAILSIVVSHIFQSFASTSRPVVCNFYTILQQQY